MNTTIFRAAAAASSVLLVAVFAGCSGVSAVTHERLARSDTSVQQAQQAIGTSESGAVELQRARDTLAEAHRALDAHDASRAEHLAQQAQLDAELAVAKSQNAAARKAADELAASIQTLRQEAGRTSAPER